MSQNERGRSRPQGLAEFLFNELRHAFQDVRQKLVEEGWFGRVTTAKPVVEVHRDHTEPIVPGDRAHEIPNERRHSFEELWSPKDRTEHAPERAPEHDIDR